METRNRIIETQNDEPQIQRLAAQRALYSQAKGLRVAQFAVVLPVTIGLAVMVLLAPSLELLNIGWAVIALLVMRFYVEQREQRLLDTAARIQEAFDCDVLEIERHPSHTGLEPDPEEIAEAARRHDQKEGGRDRLRDWYEPREIERLPLHLGRIVCQRQNCRWNGTQRARFAHRARTQPVPDWFYKRLQQNISETATQGAQDMIAEALRRLPA